MATVNYCAFADLPSMFVGDTFDGMTWEVFSDESEFASSLASARFQLQDRCGNIVQTLSSDAPGQVTINEAAAFHWSVTVEPRTLTLPAGVYTYGLELTDAEGITKTRASGILQLVADPVK